MPLKPLTSISMPNLINNDMNSLHNDIVTKIKADPEWNELWDGELFQNSYLMIMKMFEFLFERNAESTNNKLREKFLNQAFSEQAIYDNLSDMKIQIKQNKTAAVRLIGLIEGELLLEPLIIQRFYQINAKSTNNTNVVFEIIKKDDNTGKYNYFDNIIITPSTEGKDNFEVMAYAGITSFQEYVLEPSMKENFIINISEPNIIEDSIRVYYITGSRAPIELLETDSFVIEPVIMATYFPNGIPHYVIRYNADGSAKIIFGSANFGGAFEDQHIGNNILIFWRSGGGKISNINTRGIVSSDSFYISSVKTLSVNFYNPEAAAGGEDREDIFQAQVFAPYRYGRGKAIIDKPDAKSRLSNLVIKHEIDTPQYNDDHPNVQLLHAYHQIVPFRDFNNFIFPLVDPQDTKETYKVAFLNALDDFCNVVGTHDEEIEDEFVTNFIYPNDAGLTITDYELYYKSPLSGTLKATAYDYFGNVIDGIVWNTNYITDQKTIGLSLSTNASEHTVVKTKEIDYITILNTSVGRNDIIKIRFDYNKYPYTFNLQLTPGIKTYKMFAEELQALIVEKIALEAVSIFGSLSGWKFVDYEEIQYSNKAKIVFTSPSTGIDSTIEFLDNGTPVEQTNPQYNLYLSLDIEEKIYRPSFETELVFDKGNVFRYNDNMINFIFRMDRYDVEQEKTEGELNIIVDHTSEDGPIISFQLLGENNYLEKLFIGNSMTITFYDASDNPVDHIIFSNITDLQDAIGTLGSGSEFLPETYTPGSIVKSGPDNKYIYSTSTVNIRCIDNIISDLYEQSYPSIYRIDLVRIEEISPGVYNEDPGFTAINFYETSGSWTHDVSVETGKTVILQMSIEQNLLLLNNEDYMLKFIHRDEFGIMTVVETVKILNVQPGLTPLSDFVTPEVCIDQIYASNQYDRMARQIKFKLLDGILNTSTTFYNKNYADFEYIKVNFKRKTYDHITVGYRPNPYRPEDEAAELISVLGSKGNRLIGLEHLIKKIQFRPRKTNIQLIVRKDYSVANAIQGITELLYNQYSYDNQNPDHTIGSYLSQTDIKNTINTEAFRYGITDINFLETTTPTLERNTYYFFLSRSMYDRLRSLEISNSQIVGLAEEYKLIITAVSESAIQ